MPMNMNQASNFVKIRKEKILIDVNYTTDIMLNFKIGKKRKKNYFQITWETWERLFMSMCARVWIKQIWIWGHHLASDLYINNQQHLASLLWNEIICSRRLFGLVWFCFWTPFFNNTNHQTLINISLMGNWIFVFFFL